MGKAAIQAGADAVYIGAPEFGARQAAGNSIEDIAQLVEYAHLFGAQVLVTLNTLLHDDEYPRACALAHDLYKVGVDALIIQDLNLLNYDLPPIRLHASTQCDNRTPEQVLHLQPSTRTIHPANPQYPPKHTPQRSRPHRTRGIRSWCPMREL